MTTHYVIELEYDATHPEGDDLNNLIDHLDHVSGAVGSYGGHVLLTMTLPADSIPQALATATAHGRRLGEPVCASVIPEELRDAREEWETVPELCGTAAAGDALGVSRQAVRLMIDTGKLPARQVGRDWLMPLRAVEALARDRQRS